MKVYGYPDTRSARVVWVCEEAGAEYEYVHVDLPKGAARQPEYLSVNPGGKLPALVDGDLTLTESAAICLHIARKYPSASLLPPPNSTAYARAEQWCFFSLSELEQPIWSISKHTFALPEKLRVPAIMETAKWEFARAAKVLAIGLGEREYIVGDKFTVADILIANTLNWARSRNCTIESAALNAYADRMLARPALARAREREKAAS